MTTIARTRIVRIGNSRGIRIPKLLLEEANLGEEVQLQVEDGRLVVSPTRRARYDWDKHFESMARRSDDRLLDSEAFGTSLMSRKWIYRKRPH